MPFSAFTLVRNATLLDFPIEASIASVLPAVDEMVVNVGMSDDDTLARVKAIGDARIRIIESTWDTASGVAMLADETRRAMRACTGAWGIYIQADEVLADGAAMLLREAMARVDGDRRVEGLLVDYLHFYGGFDRVAINRTWYRRECRAVRLDPQADVRPSPDAQGFRVGERMRPIRCVRTGAVMHHYGWARPGWALGNKRTHDQALYPERQPDFANRPLLPWFPGITPFTGQHPAVVREWIDARREQSPLIAPEVDEPGHRRLRWSNRIERLTGWRPFEFRNYRELEER